MLLSVLVPVYNVEAYLEKCLDSIVNQADSNFEIIIIDDGSTDRSGEICDLYQNKYPNLITVLHKHNQGLLLARRDAFRIAKGDYFICCDSDDMLEPHSLKKLREYIEKTNCDLVLYNAYRMFPDKKLPYFEHIFEDRYVFSCTEKEKVYCCFLSTHSINSMCQKAIRRDLIDNHQDYSKWAYVSNGEDSLQSIYLFAKAKQIGYIDDFLYDYRCNESSMTRNFNKSYYSTFKNINCLIRSYEEFNTMANGSVYIALHLMRIAYASITQMRYQSCQLTYQEKVNYVTKITTDKYFLDNWNVLKGASATIRKRLNTKEKLIIWMLGHKMKYSISLMMTLWRQVFNLFVDH